MARKTHALHVAAHRNDAATIATLLAATPPPPSPLYDASGLTPLHHAAFAGGAEAVHALAPTHYHPDVRSRPCPPDHPFPLTPLHIAARTSNAAALNALIDAGASSVAISHASDGSGWLPAHEAVLVGSAPILATLLSTFPTVLNDTRPLLIHLAASAASAAPTLDLLIASGASTTILDPVTTFTPLHTAVAAGVTPAVATLLAVAPPAVQLAHSGDGHSPLYTAAAANHAAAASLILAHDPRPTPGDIDVSTHAAAKAGSAAALAVLLAAHSHATAPHTAAPLYTAAIASHSTLAVAALVDAAVPVPDDVLHTAAAHGTTDIVSYLLEHTVASPTHVDESGESMLHAAARANRPHMVAFLLALDPPLPPTLLTAPHTPLHAAVDAGATDAVAHLASTHPQWVTAESDALLSPLHVALALASPATAHACLALLLAHHPINHPLPHGTPLLHDAAADGRVDWISTLLSLPDSGLDIDARDVAGHTALHHAVHQCHADAVAALLDAGATPAFATGAHPLLHLAAARGDTAVLRTLLAHPACPPDATTTPDAAGLLPIHCAARRGHVDAVALLAHASPDKHALDVLDAAPNSRMTPLQHALAHAPPTTPLALIHLGSNPLAVDGLGHTALHHAAHAGNASVVEHILTHWPRSAAVANHAQQTSLHAAAAARTPSPAVVALLLAASPSVSTPDASGATPLHLAVRAANVDAAAQLVAAGAPPEASDADGTTPLHLADAAVDHTPDLAAVLRGHPPAHLTALTTAAVKIQAAYRGYRTRSLYALVKSSKSPPHAFLARHIGLHLPNTALPTLTPADVDSELHTLALAGDVDALTVAVAESNDRAAAVQQYVNPELRAQASPMAVSLLHCAVLARSPSALVLLLEEGADVHAVDAVGRTALHYAVALHSLEMATILLHGSAARDAPDTSGHTPLHYAAVAPGCSLTDLLLDEKASPYTVDVLGNTPLHLAAGTGNAAVVSSLLGSHMNPDLANGAGCVPLHLAAVADAADVCAALIAASRASVRAANVSGKTPLMLGTLASARTAVRFLLDLDLDVGVGLVDAHGFSVAHFAALASSASLLSTLLDAGADPAALGPGSVTPLHVAAIGTNPHVAVRLLDAGAPLHALAADIDIAALAADPHVPSAAQPLSAPPSPPEGSSDGAGAGADPPADAGSTGETATAAAGALLTPLRYAVAAGSVAVVHVLVDRGAVDEEEDGRDGATLVHVAASSDACTPALLHVLLDAGLDLDAPLAGSGHTPLHVALSDAGSAAAVHPLLSVGADVRARTADDKASVLHLAVAARSPAALTMLMAAGADASARNRAGRTALEMALAASAMAEVAALVNAGVDIGDGLHAAARLDAAATIPLLLDAYRLDVNGRDGRMFTPLHYAAQGGCVAAVCALRAGGGDPCAVNARSANALHLAAKYGQGGVVAELLGAVDVDAANADGATALHLAAKYGHVGVIDMLLGAGGASVGVEDGSGATPLHVAAGLAKAEGVERLLAAGADALAADRRGCTPLHVAARAECGTARPLRALLDALGAGAALDVRDADGQVPIHYAAASGSTESLSMMMQHANAPDAATPDRSGNSALHVAAARDHIEVVRILVSRLGVAPTLRNTAGETALHVAVAHGCLAVTEFLLDHPQTDINALDECGQTPLHVAGTACAEAEALGVAYALVTCSTHSCATSVRRSDDGKTAGEVAETNGWGELARVARLDWRPDDAVAVRGVARRPGAPPATFHLVPIAVASEHGAAASVCLSPYAQPASVPMAPPRARERASPPQPRRKRRGAPMRIVSLAVETEAAASERASGGGADKGVKESGAPAMSEAAVRAATRRRLARFEQAGGVEGRIDVDEWERVDPLGADNRFGLAPPDDGGGEMRPLVRVSSMKTMRQPSRASGSAAPRRAGGERSKASRSRKAGPSGLAASVLAHAGEDLTQARRPGGATK